ncbi:hypothetical protein G3O08_11985 [Cryomorpha ignava]|uniref:Uncharacterized protein n=1 Tax=Cryomorpha ignava TaxID=101383 RepID=A0A7K3WTL4_9FLAO|nr:hypothetical protein [Cryomorpha ignava]NEN24222.1 hypothetical protein [Cryomorpha ignava]
MKTTTTNIENRVNKLSHVSWGAIFAGFVAALSIIFLLNLLGVGIGFATINPLEERDPLEGLGWGTIIWWTLSNLIALFVGGMIAGRLAGFTDKMDGALHGAIAWSLYVLLSVYLITSAVGNVFSGIAGTASNLFGGDKSKVLVNYEGAQQDAEKTTNMGMDKIKQQIMQVVNKGQSLNILPDDASQELKDVMKNNDVTARGVINSLDVDEFVSDLNFDLDNEGNLKITTEGNDEYFQKEKLKTYLANNTQMTKQEIDGLIEKWETKIQKAVDKAEAKFRELKQEAIAYADKAAEAMAKFSIAAFFALLLGVAAALFGGAMGADQLVIYEKELEVETVTKSDY